MDDIARVAQAIEHELLLLDPRIRADSAALERLLSSDFTEIGKSGLVWNRVEVIAALTSQPGVEVSATTPTGRMIADDCALVEYETHGSGNRVRRSSLWIWRDDRWQVVFHQGTRVVD